MVMNLKKLDKFFPPNRSIFIGYHDAINQAFDYAQINTPQRAALFLANTSHETGGFSVFRENMNYSADRLAAVWPKRFKGSDGKPNATAKRLGRKPVDIANFLYQNRMGNGDEESGDGWFYRGGGLAMITGRAMYQEVDNEFHLNNKLMIMPTMIELKYWSAMSAGYFYKSRNLNKYADKEDLKGARKVWNGGYIGLTEVTNYYSKFLKALI